MSDLCELTLCDGACGKERACFGRMSIDGVLHAGVPVPCVSFGIRGGKTKRGCKDCNEST